MLDRISIGYSRKSISAFAKCVTGNDSALIVVKELIAKFLTRYSEIAYLRENIECALGLEGIDAYALESVIDISAAAVIFVAHHS